MSENKEKIFFPLEKLQQNTISICFTIGRSHKSNSIKFAVIESETIEKLIRNSIQRSIDVWAISRIGLWFYHTRSMISDTHNY